MIALFPLLALASLAAPPGRVVTVAGQWAAIDRGTSCEAVSRSLRAPTRSRPASVAGFRFTPDRREWGQFHVTLSQPPRAGASVILEIARQPFLLAVRGRDAWSRGSGQDRAIIAALRAGGAMKVATRDSSGRRFTDYFEVRGAPTAIDSAAARCALRSAGKMR